MPLAVSSSHGNPVFDKNCLWKGLLNVSESGVSGLITAPSRQDAKEGQFQQEKEKSSLATLVTIWEEGATEAAAS